MPELQLELEEPESPRPAGARISSYFTQLLDHLQPSSQIVLVVTAFLEAGEAPVYVGFGSMVGRNPERMANIIVEVLQKANVRGIIVTGWGEKFTDSR